MGNNEYDGMDGMGNNEYDGRRCGSYKPLATSSQEQLGQTLHTSRIQRARVRMLPQQVSEEEEEILANGEIILDGRYRIVQLLYKRPRLHLYLGRRLSSESSAEEEEAGQEEPEPLVAIRELVLTGLAASVREQIENAAFEEFVSPVVLGSSQLSTGGDRVWAEGEQHYLVMQLYDKKNALYPDVVTLAELLLDHREWPTWLNEEVALSWGGQLCRIVARLQRLGVVLGDLDLSTILVSSSGVTSWAPILLASWPPPPQFWQSGSVTSEAIVLQRQVFPVAKVPRWNAFIAPEMLSGRCDERSDVYSLGALLYLLLTHYAPVAAVHRLQIVSETELLEGRNVRASSKSDSLELILPHLLYQRISPTLERILLRALELDPILRYPSVFALIEALEASDFKAVKDAPHRESGLRKMFLHRSKS